MPRDTEELERDRRSGRYRPLDSSNALVRGDRYVVVKGSPFNAESPLFALRETPTPIEHFYIRSHFEPPSLNPDSWRLRIEGAVERPLELSLAELRLFPERTFFATMECAGNNRTGFSPLPKGEPWGAGAVSTAQWRGVSLVSVLEQAGLRPSAVELVFTGADRGTPEGESQQLSFARSLPVDKVLDPDTLIVYEMNGVALPIEHGGPVRLLVPDWYGMASVKWLVGINAAEQPFDGFFQTQRYVLELPQSTTKQALREMLIKSLITWPLSGDVLAPGTHTLLGVAWSGAGGIKSVEVSVEGGDEWRSATLVGEAAPHTWRQWRYEWNVTRLGRHVLRARATDDKGNTQPHVAAWNRLGYANNAIQPVFVQVQHAEK